MKALQDDNKELLDQVNRLRTTVGVLTEQVTQSAAVKELATLQAARHEENLLALSRLEGGVARIESKILRGE